MITVESETGIVNYEEYVGDTVKFTYNYTNSDGVTQIDLTGETLVLTVESKDNTTPFPITLTESSGLTIGGSNNIVGKLTPTNTTSMGAGAYSHKLTLTNDTSGDVNTLITGIIILKDA